VPEVHDRPARASTVGSADAEPAVSHVTRRGSARAGILALVPAFAWWLLFLVAPIGLVLISAFYKRGFYGGIVWQFTLGNFSRAFTPLYVGVFLHSIRMALVTTLICLAVGYPAAFFIATRPNARTRNILLVLVILPFWTDFLIRTYAWIILLNRQGVVNGVLEKAGLIDQPLKLLYNDSAVVVGLVYAYLPLMILPLYASIERLNPELFEAGADLGSRPVRVLRTVTLPLILPGLVAGIVFVFVPALGNFPVAELLGGGKADMIGNVINRQFLTARDWPFGSTLVLVLMSILMVLLVAQSFALRRSRGIGLDA
jgi:spermidine/putrescine transport system permease protein